MEKAPVRLHPRSPDGTALRAIEHAIVDCGRICSPCDCPVERIDLADEVPFAQPADSRIAAHRANLGQVERHQSRARTHARSSEGRLDPGMAAADYKDIE